MDTFQLSETQVIELIRDLFAIHITQANQLNGYDDLNFLCRAQSKENADSLFVLKITNPIGTIEPNVLESINEAMLYCAKNDMVVPIPLLNKEQQYLKRMSFADGQVRGVRLLKYVEGQLFLNIPTNQQLLFEVGAFVRRFQLIFQKFECEAIKSRNFSWALEKSLNIRKHLNLINEVWHQRINKILDDFEQLVIAQKDLFAHSIVHGDINEQNLLVRMKTANKNEGDSTENINYEFSLIDFGDIHFAPTVFDVAIFVTYVLVVSFDSQNLMSAKHVLDGVRSICPLTEQEMNIIPICVKARLCQSLVLGAYAASLNPENSYVLSTAKKGWPLLEQLLQSSNEKLVEMWK